MRYLIKWLDIHGKREVVYGAGYRKKTGNDRTMVRAVKAKHDDLIFNKGSMEMDFTGKAMRGFLFIEPEGFDAEGFRFLD